MLYLYFSIAESGVDKNRIENDPAFQLTRENGSEFCRIGSAGRTLRTAFRSLLLKTSNSSITSRLTQEMMKVLQPDATSARDERNVSNGELELLTGFEFTSNPHVRMLNNREAM